MKRLLFILPFCLSVSTTSAQILSVHCPFECPENTQGNDLVFAHIYALSNNPDTKFADWVAYEVNPTNYGVTTGREFRADPLLDENETLEDDDYIGANRSELESDRGHQVPLASFTGSQYWFEVNYFSNITPQDRDLNQGPWKRLEDAVRDAASYEDPLYVITGPLFTDAMPSLPRADETHTVPSGYFKIIYNRFGSTSFLMQQSASRSDDYCSNEVSLFDIQNQVNFQLPVFEESDTIKARLGCE